VILRIFPKQNLRKSRDFVSGSKWFQANWLWFLMATSFFLRDKIRLDWPQMAATQIWFNLFAPNSGNQPPCYLGLFSHFSWSVDRRCKIWNGESALRSNSIFEKRLPLSRIFASVLLGLWLVSTKGRSPTQNWSWAFQWRQFDVRLKFLETWSSRPTCYGGFRRFHDWSRHGKDFHSFAIRLRDSFLHHVLLVPIYWWIG